jgi:hypothetical protein
VLPRFALGFAAFAALALLAPVAPARAETAEQGAALCEQAIVNGARRGGVPPEVLLAVSLTETGRKIGGRLRPWPWAINREGKGHWFDDRAEALAFAEASLAQGRRSFDVGCVQINYRWHGHAFPTLDDMFDPEWTATYAAQFLRSLYEERGSWSAAAGAYHSLTPELAQVYRVRFDRLLAGIAPGVLDEATQLAAVSGPRSTGRRVRRVARIPQAFGPAMAPNNGSVGGLAFQQARGALLTEGGPLLGKAGPLLVAPRGSMF